MYTEEELQHHLNLLLERYDLSIDVKVKKDNSKLNPNEIGKFNPRTYTKIYLTEDISVNDSLLLKTLYHEFRHLWQMFFHNDMYLWWNEHEIVYREHYREPIAIEEEDARIFGFSLGKFDLENIFYKYTIEDMNNIVNTKNYDLENQIIARQYPLEVIDLLENHNFPRRYLLADNHF